MRISDWSSDVCSSDLPDIAYAQFAAEGRFDEIAHVIEAEIAAAIEPFLIDEFEDRMIERLGVDEGADVELYRAPVETRADTRGPLLGNGLGLPAPAASKLRS